MADKLNFVMGEKQPAKTEALLTLLNVGTRETPDWAPLGIRVTSSSTEMDWQKEEVVDIIGNVYANIKKPITTQIRPTVKKPSRAKKLFL